MANGSLNRLPDQFKGCLSAKYILAKQFISTLYQYYGMTTYRDDLQGLPKHFL